MAYLVLARKYRPSTFSEVVGQEHVTRTLANAFASGRVHHAFLFCGPRGVGKTTLARILGKALNCVNGPTAEPCGTCEACTSIGAGNAVDYYEMDGASNRGIDAIRELTEAVRYQPAVLRKKVYVIDEVHMLTTEAFNALLKTLEEPPPHVTFVLATTEPHKVPVTILSRCQRYDFKLVPSAALLAHLTRVFTAEGLTAEPAALSLIVRESGGSARDALSLSDQVISFVGATAIAETDVADVLGVADRALTRSIVAALAGGDAGAALTAVERAVERGVDEVQLARAIVRYLRDLAVLQAAPGATALIDASDDERAGLAAEAQAIDRARVTQMFERMLRACDDLGKTLQPRLVLDLALIDVATTEPLVPLGDLLDRLGDLEPTPRRRRRCGGGGGGRAQPACPVSAPPSRGGVRADDAARPAARAQAPPRRAPPRVPRGGRAARASGRAPRRARASGRAPRRAGAPGPGHRRRGRPRPGQRRAGRALERRPRRSRGQAPLRHPGPLPARPPHELDRRRARPGLLARLRDGRDGARARAGRERAPDRDRAGRQAGSGDRAHAVGRRVRGHPSAVDHRGDQGPRSGRAHRARTRGPRPSHDASGARDLRRPDQGDQDRCLTRCPT
ncbi:MAG: DNA polymerase III subunit gamma/tau [Kofleriaceae bacterium]